MLSLRPINFCLVMALSTSFLTHNMAVANTQSVCVNKQTGEVRVSNQCKPDESTATRKVTPPKLSKAEQLKKKISDLESQIVSIETARNALFERVLRLSPDETSIDSYFESCAESRKTNLQLEKCNDSFSIQAEYRSPEKNLFALKKMLYKYKREAGIYKTITCKKGSEILKITDENPKCPKGYK